MVVKMKNAKKKINLQTHLGLWRNTVGANIVPKLTAPIWFSDWHSATL